MLRFAAGFPAHVDEWTNPPIRRHIPMAGRFGGIERRVRLWQLSFVRGRSELETVGIP